MADDCSQNFDPLKLVREGTSQDGRLPDALEPTYAPVDARSVSDKIVFGQGYAKLLKYFKADNTPSGDWTTFFGSDVSVPLAVAAIENVDAYTSNMRSWFAFLNEASN